MPPDEAMEKAKADRVVGVLSDAAKAEKQNIEQQVYA